MNTGLFYNFCAVLQANYWGLSDDVMGCKACDCDVGGALDNDCNQQTGQCNCRPNIIGQQCDTPRPGYFVTDLDYYIYEGEFAQGSGVSTRQFGKFRRKRCLYTLPITVFCKKISGLSKSSLG